MIININGNVDNEMLDKFIEFFNNNNKLEKIIYFSSRGGNVDSASAIINLINQNKITTTLIAYSKICSCGFDIFFKSECLRNLLILLNNNFSSIGLEM